jgi:hypothetical protein
LFGKDVRIWFTSDLVGSLSESLERKKLQLEIACCLPKNLTIENLVDKVKSIARWWLKTHKIGFYFEMNIWWLNPLACLELCLS